jgi:hypothetical protein
VRGVACEVVRGAVRGVLRGTFLVLFVAALVFWGVWACAVPVQSRVAKMAMAVPVLKKDAVDEVRMKYLLVFRSCRDQS